MARRQDPGPLPAVVGDDLQGHPPVRAAVAAGVAQKEQAPPEDRAEAHAVEGGRQTGEPSPPAAGSRRPVDPGMLV